MYVEIKESKIAIDGIIIEEPAFMLDKVLGVTHAIGELENLLDMFNTWQKKDKTGLIVGDTIVIHLSYTTFEVNYIAEVINKLWNHTGIGLKILQDIVYKEESS